jgi:hypothetical protein
MGYATNYGFVFITKTLNNFFSGGVTLSGPVTGWSVSGNALFAQQIMGFTKKGPANSKAFLVMN